MQADLGFRGDGDASQDIDFEEEGYETIMLKDMGDEEQFDGKASVSNIIEFDGDFGPSKNVYLTLKNKANGEKVIAPLKVNIVEDMDGGEVVQAYKKSVLYEFLDSFYHVANGTKLNVFKRYLVELDDFSLFLDYINKEVNELTIEVVMKNFVDKKTKEEKSYNSLKVVDVVQRASDEDAVNEIVEEMDEAMEDDMY